MGSIPSWEREPTETGDGLAKGHVNQPHAQVLTASRRFWGWTAALFGLFTWVGLGNAVLKGGAPYWVFGSLFGLFFIYSLRLAIRRPAQFAVDERGLRIPSRAVRWNDVAEMLRVQVLWRGLCGCGDDALGVA